MKTRFIPLLAICGAIANPGFFARAAETAPSAPSNAAPSVPATAAPEFSGRINDVVSLTKSGVDESVVLSFIKASPGPFQPSADEIIKLRDEGIPSQVITAMLQRGAELRDQQAAETAQVTAAAQAPVITADNTVGSTATTVPTETPPATYSGDYAAPPASSVVYIGGDYSYPYYTYPYYSGYISTAFFYPFPCWFGGCFYPHGCYFPHGGFVHDGFHLHDGFHGGFVARGGFGGGFHGGFVGGRGGFVGGFRGGTVGGFHGGFVGGFHGPVVSGFRGGIAGGGFHGGAVGGGFHGSIGGGGFHGGGFSMGGGFHGGGGGFRGGGGGGFHGGGFGGGGGFHGGGGGRR